MHLNPGPIAHYFEDQSTKHGSEVAPCAISYAQEDVYAKEQGEDGQVQSIASQGWVIANLSKFKRAGVEGT